MSKIKKPVLRDEVYQSNPIIESRKDMDSLSVRVFLLGLRAINPHFSKKDKHFDLEFNEVFFPNEMLRNLFGHSEYLTQLKKDCQKIFDIIIELNHKDGGFVLMHLFQKLKYVPNKGLYLKFDDLMRPYILDLFQSRGYTKINVEQIFKLTSTYSIRLVELLLQYQNIPLYQSGQHIIREMSVEEVRFALNVPEFAYEGRMNNFRKKVLDEPIDEINKKTIYKMKYDVLKSGRNVTGFRFHMDISEVPIAISSPKSDELKFSLMSPAVMDEFIRLTVAENIFKKCTGNNDCLLRMRYAEDALDEYKTNNVVKNPLAFLRKAIENDWNGKADKAKDEKFAKRDSEYLKVDISDLRKGERFISRKTVAYFKAVLKENNNNFDRIKRGLAYYGWSVERFKEIYKIALESDSIANDF